MAPYKKNNFFNNFKKAKKIVDENKSQTKASSTREKYKSIANMQAYIDKSVEKRTLLLNTIKYTVTDKNILEKGVVIYIKLLEVIKLIEEDFKKEGIVFETITGSVTALKRMKIVDWFNKDCSNKVLFISDAGGESINIKKTNEIILYNIPDGPRKNTQTIGRVDRGEFDEVNVHLIQIENSIDEYLSILISSKKQLENELLHYDSIPLKDVSSFNSDILRAIRKRKLWKN